MKPIHAVPLLACAASMAALAAPPKPGPTESIAIKNRKVHTCVEPNNPGLVFQQKDGGYVEIPQGWGPVASVKQSTNWAIAYCQYHDNTAGKPAVYTVHYEMTGFKANQCSASGRTVTCQGPVLKP